MQLFVMCSYDIDSFREFILSSGFRNIFDMDQDTITTQVENDEELLLFAMHFLKQVLYGENSIPVKDGAREQRLEERKHVLQTRRQAEIVSTKTKARSKIIYRTINCALNWELVNQLCENCVSIP